MTKTRALADKLPEGEKSLIAVEQGAQLIQERRPDGSLINGQYIKIYRTNAQNHYTQLSVGYRLQLSGSRFALLNVVTTGPDTDESAQSKVYYYNLTPTDKAELVERYHFTYPK